VNAIATSGFLPWLEFGDLRIQSYFFVISIVLCLCAVWIPQRADKLGFPARRALDIFIVALVGGFIGSRLLHVVWEEPSYYLESPLRVFDIMAGGFVWYGGVIGAFAGAALFIRLMRDRTRDSSSASELSLLNWLDFFAPVAAFGYGAGRFACVLTGCCFGRVCEWPFVNHDHAPVLFRFPTQGFAVIWEVAVGFFILWIEKNRARLEKGRLRRFLSRGKLFAIWLVLHGIGRLIMELLRADPRGPTFGPVTISIGISLILIASATYACINGKKSAR
jgi:phosphatidylglycerol:prolipoprotein diacylglycerol transferase